MHYRIRRISKKILYKCLPYNHLISSTDKEDREKVISNLKINNKITNLQMIY